MNSLRESQRSAPAAWVARALLGAVLVLAWRARAAGGPSGATYRGSYALVVGVNDYTEGWPDLPSVQAELDTVEDALAKQGFTVQRVRSPDAKRLYAVFRDFVARHGYEPDNRLLLYFAGHGYSRRQGKIGYIVPADAPLPTTDTAGFLRHALPMNQLLAWARTMEAKHVLFVFDSCFSGTIFKSRALPQALDAKLMSQPTRQFLTAGDAGEEVPAKSVFTPVFVRGIQGQGDLNGDGLVTGSELGSFVRDKVMSYATAQTPQFGCLREAEFAAGDFIFWPDGARPPAPATGDGDRTANAPGRLVDNRRRELDAEANRVDALKRELARLRVERHGDGSAHSVATVYLLKASEMSLAAGQYGTANDLLGQVMKLEPGNKAAAGLCAKLQSLVLASQIAELEREAKGKAAALRELRLPKRLLPLRAHLLELVAGTGEPAERRQQLLDFGTLERALRQQLESKEEQTLYAELRFAGPLDPGNRYRWPFTLLICNPTPDSLSVPRSAIRGLRIQIVPHAQPDVVYVPPAPFQGMSWDRPLEELAPFAVHAVPGAIQTSGLSREPYLERTNGQPITLPDGRHNVLAAIEAKRERGREGVWSGRFALPPVEVVSGELGEQPDTPAEQRIRAALSFGKMAIRHDKTIPITITIKNTYGEPFVTNFSEALRTMTIHFEPVKAPSLRPFQLPSPFRTGKRGTPRPFTQGGYWSTATHLPPNLPANYLGKRYRVHLELNFPEAPDAWSGTVRSPAVEVTILPEQ